MVFLVSILIPLRMSVNSQEKLILKLEVKIETLSYNIRFCKIIFAFIPF